MKEEQIEEKTEGKRVNCQFCANCDSNEHCIAKENLDFFECKNDEHFETIKTKFDLE